MTQDFLQLCTLYNAISETLTGPDQRGVATLDPDELQRIREEHWRGAGRHRVEQLILLLMDVVRYLSDVIGGEVPALVPRTMVETNPDPAHTRREDALQLGNAVQRSIAAQVTRNVGASTEELLTAIRELLGERPASAVPPSSKWLSTQDIAERLNLDAVTVARLCKKRLIVAQKTAGGLWRTTEDRLRRSPYLKGQTRKPRSGRNGELE
jgi:hypothetical protein